MEVTDKSWRFKHRASLEYEAGVDEFIKFAITHADDETCIVCPCRVCKNFESLSPTEVKDHLIEKGIDMACDPFYLHGEEVEGSSEEHSEEHTRHAVEDHANDAEIYEMFQATYESNTKTFPSEAKKKSKIEKIIKDANKPLYKGCTKYNKLDAVVALYSLKANSGMSNKYFSDLLKLLKDMLPEDNVIPKSTNSARSLLRKFDLDYQEIHACVNS